jgi:hypothetical protein
VRDDLGVVDGHEHGDDQDDPDERDEHRPEVATPDEHQHEQGDDRRSDVAERGGGGDGGHGAEAVTTADERGAGWSSVLRRAR